MSKTQITTFRDIRGYTLDNLKIDKPFCTNSVSVEKFKITVEKIDEPKEVYKERLEKLLIDANHYEREDIKRKAKELGIQIQKV